MSTCVPEPMECDTSCPHLDPEKAEEAKINGNAEFKLGNYPKACEFYGEAIYHSPSFAVYYGNRSAALMMLGRYGAALDDCTKAIQLDDAYTKGYLRAAKCHLMLGNPALSLDYYQKVLVFERANKQALEEIKVSKRVLHHLEQAQLNIVKGEHRTAVFHMDRCLDDAPSCLMFKTLKAEALMFSKLYDDAHSLANDLMRADSNNVDALYVKAMCFYYQDVQDRAKLFFQNALRMDPDHKKSREAIKKTKALLTTKEQGNEAFKAGEYNTAIELYTKALKIDPLNTYTNAKLFCNRALVRSKMGDNEEAVHDCTSAIALDENYVRAYQRRAKLYQTLEKFEEAVFDYEKINRLEPSRENDGVLREAKRLLKLSQRKDYYKILGVEKSASQDDIKKAYRKLAMKHHPDRHSSAELEVREAEEKIFKEVSSAYSILSDPDKRRRFDSGQDLEDMNGMEFDPNELFSQFFSFGGGGQSFGGSQRRRGPGNSFFSFQGGPGMHFEF